MTLLLQGRVSGEDGELRRTQPRMGLDGQDLRYRNAAAMMRVPRPVPAPTSTTG